MSKILLPLALLPVLAFAQPAQAQQVYGYQDQVDTYDETYGPDPYASRENRFNDDQYRAYRREMAHRWRMQHGYPLPPDRDYGSNQNFDDNGGNVPYAAPVYPVNRQAPGKVLVQQGGKPAVTKKKPVAPAKPAAATAATTPAPAATPPAAPATASTSTATAPAAPATATASAAPAAPPAAAAPAVTTPAAAAIPTPAKAAATAPAKKGGPVTCDKGASIVSSFGFDKVTNKTCEGASLVYSAERGGKPFEIEVNPKSGELTAVKKL